MTYKSNLLSKIKYNKAKIGVIGLGYVGLPLACSFAKKKFQVIGFDKNGQCNYCLDFQNKIEKFKINKKNLFHLVKKIKESNNNNEYDCIVGLSGGIDSSYTLVKVVESGLKPLVVHLDNGWNSELAQNNIENLINKLNLDLFTYVIDWSEYREMMEFSSKKM